MSISIRSLMKALAAGTVTVLLCAAPAALAQDAYGQFTIAKEVHWGNATLAPGTYTYSLEHHASEILVVRPAGGGPGYLVMPRSVGKAEPTDSDRLVLEKSGDRWFVSSITVHDLDEELFFAPPASLAPEASRTRIASVSAP